MRSRVHPGHRGLFRRRFRPLIPLPNLPSLARLGPAQYETFQALSRMGMTAKDVLALIAANGGAVSTAGLVRADGSVPLTATWNAGNFNVDSKNTERIFNVRAFGALDDNSTDATAAIQAAITALNAAGSGTLYFPRVATGIYKVTSVLSASFPTLTNVIFAPTTLSGLRMIGEGVTIADQTTYTGTQDAGLFTFTACANVAVSGINFTAPRKATYASPHGLVFLGLLQGCSVISIDATFDGGWAGLVPYKQYGDPESYKSGQIRANLKTESVERPYFAYYSGNNVDLRLTTNNSGRDFILVGARQTDIHLVTSNMQGTCEIDHQSGISNEDIRAWIWDHNSTTRNSGNPSCIIQFTDTVPATARNIEINFDITAAQIVGMPAPLAIWKLNGGSADTVGRGHVLDGLKVSGLMDPWSASDIVNMVGQFNTPDVVRRVSFDRISGPDSTSGINFAAGTALADVIEVSNCNIPVGPINVTASTGLVVVRNTLATNYPAAQGRTIWPSNGNLTLANGRNDNVVVGDTSFVQAIAGPSAAFQISGIVPTTPASNGQLLVLVYGGGQVWTINHNDANSAAANRIYCPGSASITPNPLNGTVTLIYDPGFPGWVMLSRQ